MSSIANGTSAPIRLKHGDWSFAVAKELLSANPFLDPATFTHAQLANMIQRLGRTDEIGRYVNAASVRMNLEWLIWDRDGWRHADSNRHVRHGHSAY